MNLLIVSKRTEGSIWRLRRVKNTVWCGFLHLEKYRKILNVHSSLCCSMLPVKKVSSISYGIRSKGIMANEFQGRTYKRKIRGETRSLMNKSSGVVMSQACNTFNWHYQSNLGIIWDSPQSHHHSKHQTLWKTTPNISAFRISCHVCLRQKNWLCLTRCLSMKTSYLHICFQKAILWETNSIQVHWTCRFSAGWKVRLFAGLHCLGRSWLKWQTPFTFPFLRDPNVRVKNTCHTDCQE